MDKLVYLTYPIMILVLLIGAKWYRKGQWNESFMSIEQSKLWQGYFALCIMLHHVSQETCASWQSFPLIPGLELFVEIGYFCVAMFIMCSGYGLYKSYQAKPNYLKGFFTRRILPLIIAFYSTGLIFFLARVLMKEEMNGWKIFCYISGWGLPNPNAWFVVAMPYFYACFYLAFRFGKTEGMKIAGTILGVAIYTVIGACVNHNDYWMRGEWWYNSVHLFWIGILFARYEAKLLAFFKKHYYLYLVLAAAATYGFFQLSMYFKSVYGYYGELNPSLSQGMVIRNRFITLSAEMLASLAFVLTVLILSMKLKINNRILAFMGTITLEFYLIHGLFLELFAYSFCDVVPSIVRITNVFLLIIVVLVPSILSALFLKWLHGKVLHLSQSRKL